MDYVHLSMISSTISEQHSAAEVAQDGDTRQTNIQATTCNAQWASTQEKQEERGEMTLYEQPIV